MPCNTCMTATMTCPFGAAPSKLLPTPRPVLTSNKIAANIMDFAPIVNVPPFGMCSTPSNPMVAAATAAALGVLTPVPCLPVPVGPWKSGAVTVMLANFPALDNISTLNCMWGGVITFVDPGQVTHMVP